MCRHYRACIPIFQVFEADPTEAQKMDETSPIFGVCTRRTPNKALSRPHLESTPLTVPAVANLNKVRHLFFLTY